MSAIAVVDSGYNAPVINSKAVLTRFDDSAAVIHDEIKNSAVANEKVLPSTAIVTAAHFAPAWEHLTRLDHRYGTTKAIRHVVFYNLGLTVGQKKVSVVSPLHEAAGERPSGLVAVGYVDNDGQVVISKGVLK